MVRYLIPLGVFLALVVLFSVGLTRDPKLVPSPLVDKPAPAFELPIVGQPQRALGTEDLAGRVVLLNVWASWCVACRQEHPFLMELTRNGRLPIYGLNYKDEEPDALRWLAQFGNPYVASAADRDGRIGIDWGVYGVPETFVLDRQGVIRHKQIGPITPQVWENEMLPLIERLEGETS